MEYTDKDAFKDFLKSRPVAFYPDFAHISGSVNAGVLLSQLFYWKDKESDPEGWIYKTQKDWLNEICLTRSEQEGARKKLRECKFMTEKLKGNPAKLYYKINFDNIIEALKALYQARNQDAENLHAEIPHAKDAENAHTSMQETSTLSLHRLPSEITTKKGAVGTAASPALNRRLTDLIGEAHKYLKGEKLEWKGQAGKYGKALKTIMDIVSHETDDEAKFQRVREKCIAYVEAAKNDEFLKRHGVTPLSLLNNWNKVQVQAAAGSSVMSKETFPNYKAMSPDEIKAAFVGWKKKWTEFDLKKHIAPESFKKFVQDHGGYTYALPEILIEEVHGNRKSA